ncbi:MAG: response regulator transcription factor [Opitutales bacterium]
MKTSTLHARSPSESSKTKTMKSETDPQDTTRKTRIFIVDDHPLMRQAISQVLLKEPDMTVCGEASSAAEALEEIQAESPDIVIADLSLQGMSGIDLIKNLKSIFPELPILVLSMHDESIYAQRVLRAGGQGYVMKEETAEKVVQGIRRILAGDIYVSERVGAKMLQQIAGGRAATKGSPVDQLTDRELQVIQLIGEGRSTREIAAKLDLSMKTVESHRAHAMEKLNLKNSTELVHFSVLWVANENKPG